MPALYSVAKRRARCSYCRPFRTGGLSSIAPNGKSFRITVKREPDGVVSNWLDDRVELSATLKVSVPAGEFFLAYKPERPGVLLIMDVGLTPVISMLEKAAKGAVSVTIHYIHGTLDGSTHAIGAQVRRLAERTANISATTFYVEPRADDVRGRDYNERGLITGDWLRKQLPVAGADFHLCGPKPFLPAFVGELTLAGVPADRLHYQFFGPTDELIAA